MRSTGIVRKVDELGRIVIPKGNPETSWGLSCAMRWKSLWMMSASC